MLPIQSSEYENISIFFYRVLGFSLSPIESVSVKLDDGVWQKCNHIRGPLHVLPWKPELYETGVHQIHVSKGDLNMKCVDTNKKEII